MPLGFNMCAATKHVYLVYVSCNFSDNFMQNIRSHRPIARCYDTFASINGKIAH